MLYKFKSEAAPDLIMLEANGRQLLTLIGKDPGPKGIILPQDMDAAMAAIEAAIAAEVAVAPEAGASDTPVREQDRISLRQRAVPFMQMLQRCRRADKHVVWGV
jgi:hypothetical protein